jgi:hypothetical protein
MTKTEASRPSRYSSMRILSPADPNFPVLAKEALQGVAGACVRSIDPHTEADLVAVLANLLCWFGNAIGRGAFVRVGADSHYLNLFLALVGETAKGRE